MSAAPTHRELPELAVDVRLAGAWEELADFPFPWDIETAAVFMRYAYGRGYMDALKDGGVLLGEHGYAKPPDHA